jgi:hypothetical protein
MVLLQEKSRVQGYRNQGSPRTRPWSPTALTSVVNYFTGFSPEQSTAVTSATLKQGSQKTVDAKLTLNDFEKVC